MRSWLSRITSLLKRALRWIAPGISAFVAQRAWSRNEGAATPAVPVSSALPQDEFKMFYQLSVFIAVMMWLDAFLDMSGILRPPQPSDFFAYMYLFITAPPAAFNELIRLTDGRAYPRYDSFLGAAMLAGWGGVAAVLSVLYPDRPLPLDFAQAFAGTVVIVALCRLSRWLCGLRESPADWRLMPEECDRMLMALEHLGELGAREAPRLAKGRYRWVMDLLVRENFAEMHEPPPHGFPWKLRFKVGAKSEWGYLVTSILVEIADKDYSWSIAELANDSSCSYGSIGHRHWHRRAVFRLLRLGLIEKAPERIDAYRITRLGKELAELSDDIAHFLPYDGSMSLPEIEQRARCSPRMARAAIELLVLSDEAEAMAAQPGEPKRYRSTCDWDARFTLSPETRQKMDEERGKKSKPDEGPPPDTQP